MLNQSEISQLRRHARDSVQSGALNLKGGRILLEVLDHYEAFPPERIQEPATSDKSAKHDSKRGSSGRSRRASRKR
jgi:hypothetical protein